MAPVVRVNRARSSTHWSARRWCCLFPLMMTGSAGCVQPSSAVAWTPGLQAERVVSTLPARADTVDLLLYLPRDRADGELWPAILHLHGGSQPGTDLEKLKAYGLPRLADGGADLPFVLIAPQLPEGEIWSDAEPLMGLIEELSARYPLDPDRLYATGMSMGGRGAWYLAFRYPERFAAIAPVAAFQPITYWASSGRLRGVPVRAYHGDLDPLAPFADAVRMHEALLDAGVASELVVLPGRDHFVADALDDPELIRWLLTQRRSGTSPCVASER
jgi:predicted peptidase